MDKCLTLQIDSNRIIGCLCSVPVGSWMIFDAQLCFVYNYSEIPVVLIIITLEHYSIASIGKYGLFRGSTQGGQSFLVSGLWA